MNTAMQVITFSHDQCVIVNPASLLGIYFGLVIHLVFLGRFICQHFIPRLRSAPGEGWKALPTYFVAGILIPLYISGSSDRITLTASDRSLRLEGQTMLIPRRTKLIHLEELDGARVGGKNSWLLLDFRNGGEVGIGDDASLGGRATAANAINEWLAQYRGKAAPVPAESN